jgi:hypothetical protein
MHEPLIGRVIAGQRIEGVAGRGGMGVVYRATDLDLERRVAVKVIAPALADDPAFRRRFIDESRIAASLDHPNVITIHRAGEEEGVLFLVMRFVDGVDLRGVLARDGPLDPGRALRILTQVASALDAAHASGLVHRDVKPANILLGAGDHVYLTDFGLSKRTASADATRTAQLVGTLNYVAPEQIRGHQVDARTDVYALGAVLFQMLTGGVPFPAETDEAKMWAHLSEPPPRASELRPGVPAGLDEVIRRAMSKSPDERYPTAGELAAAAASALESARPAPAAAPPSRAPAPRARPMPARYTRSHARKALVLNALTDTLAVVAAAAIIIAGILFGALAVAVPLALAVYAAGAARAFFDEDTARKVIERDRARRRGERERGRSPVDLTTLSPDIRGLVDRAHETRNRVYDAIERADLPYTEVSAEVDQLVTTMEQTAKRAQLLHDGLSDAPPAEVARRLEQVKARAHPAQHELVTALEYQLSVQRRMEQQLQRFHDQMDRMVVELDTVRGNLISASASAEAYEQERVAGGIRELRDEMGAVADGMAAAYDDREGASAALERVSPES